MLAVLAVCARVVVHACNRTRFTPTLQQLVPTDVAETHPSFGRFKIKFDTSFLKNQNDAHMCKTEGETINGRTCHLDDLISPRKLEIVEEALAKVKTQLEKTLSVRKWARKIEIAGSDRYPPPVAKVSRTDLHVTVYARYFEHKETYAFGSVRDNGLEPSQLYRPVAGILEINPRSVADIEGYDRFILHEVVHILGISEELLKYWAPGGKRLPQTLPYVKATHPEYQNIPFYLVNTEKSHDYVVRKFNVEWFSPSVPSGIEMEREPTLSHLKARVYFGELMTARPTNASPLSAATISLLRDTGWYHGRYDLSEPHCWGSGAAFGQDPWSHFPYGAPQSVFPQEYFCEEKVSTACSADYTSITRCSGVLPETCPSNTPDGKRFCENEAFYNSEHRYTHGRGEAVNDFQMFPTPAEHCGKGSICLQSSIDSAKVTSPQCIKMRCVGQSLLLYIGNQTMPCPDKPGPVMFPGLKGFVMCPDAQIVCTLEQFREVTSAKMQENHSKRLAIAFICTILVAALATNKMIRHRRCEVDEFTAKKVPDVHPLIASV